MILNSCAHENEVTQLLERAGGLSACSPELRAHLSACRSCGDLALVTESFQRARAETVSAARLGSPGTLWWRAQLRRRNAAVERIGKPILGAQIFALAINLIVLAGLLASQARRGLAWLTSLEQLTLTSTLHLWPSALLHAGGSLTALTLTAGAALALLGGVAVFLATEKP
jgi:hypothetical protein